MLLSLCLHSKKGWNHTCKPCRLCNRLHIGLRLCYVYKWFKRFYRWGVANFIAGIWKLSTKQRESNRHRGRWNMIGGILWSRSLNVRQQGICKRRTKKANYVWKLHTINWIGKLWHHNRNVPSSQRLIKKIFKSMLFM